MSNISEQKRWLLVAAVMLVFLIFRILLANLLGEWVPEVSGIYNVLMDDYVFTGHILGLYSTTFAKAISFPIFLRIAYQMGLSYASAISLLYGIAGFSVFALAYRFTTSKKVSLFFYLYMLFLPVGFEVISTRVYRFSIIPPMIGLLFSLILLKLFHIICGNGSKKKQFLLSVLVGVIGFFAAHIDGDGVWIIACMVLAAVIELIWIVSSFFKKRKEGAAFPKHSLIAALVAGILPLLILAGSTGVYKAVEYHFVDVLETNTQTEEETAVEENWLQEDDCVQPVSSESGKTLRDFWDLRKGIWKAYAGAVILSGYSPGGVTEPPIEETDNHSYQSENQGMKVIGNRIVEWIFWAYRIINVEMVIFSAVIVVLALKRGFQKSLPRGQELWFPLIGMLLLFLITFVYAFMTSWNGSFLDFARVVPDSCPLPSILAVMFVLAVRLARFLYESRSEAKI